MITGFPIHLVAELSCTKDGAALQPGKNCQLSEDGNHIGYGTLVCNDCGAAYAIDGGILNMLNHVALDDESKHEQTIRNKGAQLRPDWYENEHNVMEMIPTLSALSANLNTTILELGCGDGRYTVPLAGQCKWLLAADFSLESLRILQQRLQNFQNVGLVHADVTTMKVSAASFDRVFSTLVSNLPTREHRNAMYHLAAHALKPDGRFVFSTHHHGIRQKLRGEEKSGRYRQGGIYRYNFTVSECKAEVQPYFKAVKARPIQIYFPFAHRLGLPLAALSRILEAIPLLNGLGEIVLCTAELQRTT